MAGVVHISEEEAARDFAALVKHERLGDEVLLECGDGVTAVVKRTDPHGLVGNEQCDAQVKARSIDAIIDALEKRKERQGLAILDAYFEADVAEARARYHAPRDHSAWD